MSNIIGNIDIRVGGEQRNVELTSDGFVILPGGTKRKLPEDKFLQALEQIQRRQEEEALKSSLMDDDDEVVVRALDEQSAEVPAAEPPAPVEPPKPAEAPVEQAPAAQPAPVIQPVMQPGAYQPFSPAMDPEMRDDYVAPTATGFSEPEMPAEAAAIIDPPQKKKHKKEKPVETQEEHEESRDVVYIHGKNGKGPLVAVILMFVVLLLVFGAFVYGMWSGMLTFNNNPYPVVSEPITPNEPEDPVVSEPVTPPTDLPTATPEELDEARTVVIVARIVTPEGEEKEVVLGYFTIDNEDAAILEEQQGAQDGDPLDDESTGDATGVVYLTPTIPA